MSFRPASPPLFRPASLIVLFLLAAGCSRSSLPAAAVATSSPTPLPELGQHPQHTVIRSTVYPDADHEGSWRHAYAEPELYVWLLEHRLE